MHCNYYLRNGVVFIPTWAQTVDGLYVGGEPISVIPVGDTQKLVGAFKEMFARGNPKIPRIDFRNDTSLDVRHYAGVKSWKAFDRGTTSWSVDEKHGTYVVKLCRKDRDGGWVVDPDQIIPLPLGTGVDEACARIVEMIQAKASE